MVENDGHMYVSQDFKKLCFKIQNDRVIEGTDTIKNKLSLPKVTKTITNMINANPKLLKTLVEVKQNGTE